MKTDRDKMLQALRDKVAAWPVSHATTKKPRNRPRIARLSPPTYWKGST